MLAIQMKRTLLKDDETDLIMGYPCLSQRYKNPTLQNLFVKVLYFDQFADYHWRLNHFFSPTKALKSMFGDDQPQKYTDIYFWNPDWVFYYYYKLCRFSYNKVNWHVYGDAISQFFSEVPEIDSKFSEENWKGRLLNRMDWLIWGIPRGDIHKLKYDFFMFRPEKFIGIPSRKHIEIPIINGSDKKIVSLYNDIFEFDYKGIDGKIIYIDTARDGQINNSDIIEKISKLQQKFGEKNVIVKPHPRADMNIYSSLNVRFLDKDMPCELFFLNGGMTNKVIVCQFSSAVCLSFLLFGISTDIVSTIDFVHSSSKYIDISKKFLSIIQNETNRVSFPKNDAEMLIDIEKCIHYDEA